MSFYLMDLEISFERIDIVWVDLPILQERVRFHNTGPSSVPGVIVMGIEDGEGFSGLSQLDPIYSYIVVIINVCPTDITYTSPSLKEKDLQLHPIQVSSTDHIVKNSMYDSSSGSFRDAMDAQGNSRPPILNGENYSLWKQRMREEEWTVDELALSNWNSKTINTLCGYVDSYYYKVIKKYESAKDPCDELQRVCEGIHSVEKSRLRMLTATFELMRMDYAMRLSDIANECEELGEVIEEAKETNDLEFDALLGTLKTFEMEHLGSNSKDKNVALTSDVNSDDDEDIDWREILEKIETTKLGEEEVSLISQRFNKHLKRKNNIGGSYSKFKPETPTPKSSGRTFAKFQSSSLESKIYSFPKPLNEVQGHECKEVEETSDRYEKLRIEYEELFANCGNQLLRVKAFTIKVNKLTDKKDDQYMEYWRPPDGYWPPALLWSRLQETLSNFNKGKAKLDEILDLSVPDSSKHVIVYKSDQQIPESSQILTIKRHRRRRRQYVCHHCGERGHIRPFCWKIVGKQSLFKRSKLTAESRDDFRFLNTKTYARVKQVWVKKNEIKCNMIYLSLKSYVPVTWYFDSGCSKHMIGSEDLLSNTVKFQGGKVKYGGGANGQIIGQGTLHVPGIAKLENVLLVEGLTANLISISQLSDGGFSVKFTHEKCERTSDNCFQIHGDVFYKLSQLSDAEVWHQKLGYVNYKMLERLTKKEAMNGLHKLNTKIIQVCEACQKGKQVRVSHQNVQSLTTSNCFELIHMDLMGPLEVKSIGGVETEDAGGDGTGDMTPNLTPTQAAPESDSDLDEEDPAGQIDLHQRNIPLRIRRNHPTGQIIGDLD
ncbi:pullulanase 1 chloroplastic [Phtheirospermum japonicum]|uniref:Pullulanase 1 chloroplastic n=1 Tax=Phtheirospermum japonicum TaxID=374723 RepID=A0A830C7V4_9LAMI|nr:pullulanase 1 chloroplastic [Phtheirospermum japonicum]